MYNDEQIAMIPTKKGQDLTTVTMERLKISEVDKNNIIHVAGGDHTGIVIFREPGSGKGTMKPPELVLGFNVMLRNSSSNRPEQENWQLKFWFKDVQDIEKIDAAESFLTELISSGEHPRDYVGFISKTMKLMQIKYPCIQKVEVEMRKHAEDRKSVSPSPGWNVADLLKQIQVQLRGVPKTKKGTASSIEAKISSSKLTSEQETLLDIIEAVYPNSLPVSTVAKSCNIKDEDAQSHLIQLQARGLVKRLNSGNYMRITKSDSDVKMVKQIPMIPQNKQPLIAIITAQYFEKVAVDAMIDNKETFVKFKTEGESNVYTLGNIGRYRVVSTKLPATGTARGAVIAAGSTTTRLLGSFPRVDFVFLVGVGGGVPHCYDYTKHVRLGDVVVSTPPDKKKSYIYLFCDALQKDLEDVFTPGNLTMKTWCPPSLQLQNIACSLWRRGYLNKDDRPWERYIEDNLKDKDSSFNRPNPETDKIYCMSVEGGDLVDVGHPQPMDGDYDPRKPGMPVLHFGAVGSGRVLMNDDTKRLAFAEHNGIMSFDTGFRSVVESIFGNCKDDYVFIRGISDYKDGTKKKEWQPYSALAAAAVMKSIICNLEL